MDAIHELIASMTTPQPIPGMKIRMMPPGVQPPPALTQAPPTAIKEQPKPGEPERQAPQPAQAAEPKIDINAVADQVYRNIVRRQKLERERKGLY